MKRKEPSKCTYTLTVGMTQKGRKGLISIKVLPKYANITKHSTKVRSQNIRQKYGKHCVKERKTLYFLL